MKLTIPRVVVASLATIAVGWWFAEVTPPAPEFVLFALLLGAGTTQLVLIAWSLIAGK